MRIKYHDMNIISVGVEQGYMVDRKPCWEPCLYRVWVFLNRVNLWSEFSIRSNWWRTKSFFREFNYVFMFKMPSPPLQTDYYRISWTLCLISSLSHSWQNFKFFSLSFLSYFGLIISCILLCKEELCSKEDFIFV